MLLFAFRNLFRQKFRTFLSLLIIIVSVFCIVFIGGLYENMFNELKDSLVFESGHLWVSKNENLDSDYVILSDEIVSHLKEDKLVNKFRISGNISGVIGYEDKSSMFSGELFNPNYDMDFYQVNKQTVKIGKILANNLGVKEGDEISGFGDDYSFTVIIDEIVETGSEDVDSFYISIPFECLTEENDEIYELTDTVYFNLNNLNQESLDSIMALFNAKCVKFHMYNDESSYYSQVRKIYESNLGFIIIALIITNFFSIATSYTMIISERLWEIGTQKTFGFNLFYIVRSMLYEAVILSVIGFIIGLSLTIFTGLIVNALGGVVLPPPPTVSSSIILKFMVSTKYVFLSLIEVVLTCLLSVLMVSIGIVKKPVTELLA